MLVAEATDGSDTNLVIAALLHDAVEDSEVPREMIAETFGDDVASIVVQVTDDKSLPKAARKSKQVETARGKSARAKMLKLADKTSNLRAIAASPPSDWSVRRRIEYVEFALARRHRPAGGAINSCYLLCSIDYVGDREAVLHRECFHVVE